jgi:hypothetical protein
MPRLPGLSSLWIAPLLLCAGSASAETINLDLARVHTLTQTVPAGDHVISASNLMPKQTYRRSVLREARLNQALVELNAFAEPAPAPGMRMTNVPSACDSEVTRFSADLAKATSEKDIAQLLKNAYERLAQADCPPARVQRTLADVDPIVA